MSNKNDAIAETAPEMTPEEIAAATKAALLKEDGPMIECENLVKIYKAGEIEVLALQGLDLTVHRGELVAIIGNSGSGKSTLLNMLGGLDRPSAGQLIVDGRDLLKFNERQMVKYKRESVGFVWQNNARNLIPYLTAQQNVELPMSIASANDRAKRASDLLELVGLSHRKASKLSQLSGGEQQRVAIAIALANNPKMLLADEPTGAVDTKTAAMILDVFNRLNKELGVTIVIVTHDRQVSKRVDRVVAIRDGRTSSEFLRASVYAERLANFSPTSYVGDDDHHEEFAVLDRSGRFQLPKELCDTLGLKGGSRLRLEMQDGKVIITNPEKQEAQPPENI